MEIKATHQIGAGDKPSIRQKISVMTRGFSWIPSVASKKAPEISSKIYDCIIVGGGLSGLTSAYQLRDKKILLLEASSELGGIAAYGQIIGLLYSRGGVYTAEPAGKMRKLMDELGLPSNDELRVPEPTDSYYYKGRLIKNALKEGAKDLPPQFAEFFRDLRELGDKFIEEPITHPNLDALAKHLDSITAAEFVRPYGKEVKEFLDLYSRSTFGATTDKISALAFLSFYYDELLPKYAFQSGTSGIAISLAEALKKSAPDAALTSTTAFKVHNTPEGLVEVTYHQRNGKIYKNIAKTVVMATPLLQASRMVPEMAPEKKAIIDDMEYCSYLVHNVILPKPIYSDSYITWGGKKFFTDFVASSWVQTKGYTINQEGADTIAIYNPLPPRYWNKKMTYKTVIKLARKVFAELKELIPAFKSVKDITIETSVWAPALPLVYPGFLTKDAPTLRKPDGNIVYGGQNLSLPCVEGSINTALDAAEQVRSLLSNRFLPVPIAPKPELPPLTRTSKRSALSESMQS